MRCASNLIYYYGPMKASILNKAKSRLWNSPLKLRLASGAFWGVAATACARGLILVSSFFVARILGREGFGEWGIVQTTVGMIGVLAGFGLGVTATKYIAEFRKQDPARAGRIIGLSTLITFTLGSIGAVAFWILSPWLAARTLNAPHLTGALRVGALYLFFIAIDEAQKGTLAGFEEFRLITKITFWTGIVSVPMMLAGIYWGGLKGGVGALSLNMAVTWLWNLRAIHAVAKRQGICISYAEGWKERSIIWTFCVPAFLGQSLTIPVNWALAAFLAHQAGGYKELGLFNAANQWRGVLLYLPYAAGRIILPVMTDLHSSAETERLKKAYRGITLFFLALTGAGFATVSLCSRIILKGYGPAFVGGEKVMIVLAFTAVAGTLLFINNQLLYSTNKIWYSVLSNAAVSVVLLGTAFFLIPRHGALGLALTLAIGTLCEAFWKMSFLKANKWI